MVILDSNVIIDFLDGKQKVIDAVNKYPPSELATTFVNEFELLKYKDRVGMEKALENLQVYHSTESSVRAAASAYRLLKAKGRSISDNDLLIFGVASANNETILTQDKGFKNLESDRIMVLD